MQSIFGVFFRYGNWIVAGLVIFVLYQAFSGQPVGPKPSKISDEQFASAIENDSVPVIVKFGATGCPPCRTTDKALGEFEIQNPGKANITIVDVELNPDLASRYSVSSIPHSFLFFRGNLIDEHVGGMDAEEINSWLDKKLIQFPKFPNSK